MNKVVQKIKATTSWGRVAGWYDNLLSNEDSFQQKVIAPNLLRVLNPLKGEKILDIACGQGYFARLIHKAGAKVTAADISSELVELAKKQGPAEIRYLVLPAENLNAVEGGEADAAVVVLALQNIKNLSGAISELARVLKPKGRAVLVLNHPAFRIPGKSDWGFESGSQKQFRKLYAYLSEFSKEIDMHPGKKLPRSKKYTYSFHRPLQVYFKEFFKHGFAVTRLEEWVSHKISDSGPKAEAENFARKEFPLFLAMEIRKI